MVVPRVLVVVPRVLGVVPRVLGVVPWLVGVVPWLVGVVPRVLGVVPRVLGHTTFEILQPEFPFLLRRLFEVNAMTRTTPPRPRGVGSPGVGT